MNLAAVMDQIGTALGAISGLRVHPYESDRVTPPAVVVAWPDSYEFDQTMQRGSDRVVFPATVIVGRADARSSRNRLADYCAGSGASSVKAAIEAQAGGSVWDSARVVDVEFGAVTTAGVTYLAATFNIEITGKGA